MKIMFTLTALIFIFMCFHSWYLFITDSVCSLEGIYVGLTAKDEKKVEKKLFKNSSVKAIVVKDGFKFIVNLKHADESLGKGDVIKFYTTPSCVIERSNGTIEVTNTLSFFVTKSTDITEEESDDE